MPGTPGGHLLAVSTWNPYQVIVMRTVLEVYTPALTLRRIRSFVSPAQARARLGPATRGGAAARTGRAEHRQVAPVIVGAASMAQALHHRIVVGAGRCRSASTLDCAMNAGSCR